MQSSADGRIPVFVFPHSVTFYLEDQTTHKQVLTLYNPYDFPVRFAVLCTNPKKYHVTDAEGSIKAKNCIDIVIRHTSISLASCQITDKFRIHMFDFVTKQVLGRRDVTATLVSGEPERSTPDREFETLPPLPASHKTRQQQYSLDHRPERPLPQPNPNQYVLLGMAAVCIAILFLPMEGEESIFTWKASINLKLVSCYVLGLLTMAIVRHQ